MITIKDILSGWINRKSTKIDSVTESANTNMVVKNDRPISILRQFQNDLLKHEVAQLQSIQTVLNIGAIQDDVDKEGGIYRNYFHGREYYTLDKNRADSSPFHFTCDIQNAMQINKKFDLIMLMNVLEHLENPSKTVQSIMSILSENGYLFVLVPFFYPIHKDPQGRFGDYWRFTDDGLRLLFADFDEVWIKSADSVILAVKDRDKYWERETTTAGYGALFRKK